MHSMTPICDGTWDPFCAMLNTQVFIYPDEQRVQHFGWLTDGDMKKARSIIVEVSELPLGLL